MSSHFGQRTEVAFSQPLEFRTENGTPD